jgi:hypothetical protein
LELSSGFVEMYRVSSGQRGVIEAAVTSTSLSPPCQALIDFAIINYITLQRKGSAQEQMLFRTDYYNINYPSLHLES